MGPLDIFNAQSPATIDPQLQSLEIRTNCHVSGSGFLDSESIAILLSYKQEGSNRAYLLSEVAEPSPTYLYKINLVTHKGSYKNNFYKSLGEFASYSR